MLTYLKTSDNPINHKKTQGWSIMNTKGTGEDTIYNKIKSLGSNRIAQSKPGYVSHNLHKYPCYKPYPERDQCCVSAVTDV
jgi:hypothetical protein